MIQVKFIVFLFYIVLCACYSRYCEISPSHVLCRYPVPGPGANCREYDGNTFLTDDDINDLINRINERRNFIAMGRLRRFPEAANMNKVVWSEELATFAQRWVDQCDPSLRPDKEDQCRDLEHVKVGQNIASILNPSPEFSVKSFIDMWFMKTLDYTGSVSYYNQYQDYSSNYFTQLIWADTRSVGCGRAKFKVNNLIVERLVCNFSPKGNVHGKPVYAIGIPGTQCQNHMIADEKFKGLCTQRSPLPAKFPSKNPPASNFLRILNLSNDSVKQEIDPIYNNIKQINRNTNGADSLRHQIMRHIARDKLISTRTPNQETNFWESPVNMSRHKKWPFQDHENSYSKLHYSDALEMEGFTKSHFKLKHSPFNTQNNYKTYNVNKQCTRKTECQNKDCRYGSTKPYDEEFYQCTRGQRTNSKKSTQGLNPKPVTNTIQYITQYDQCGCETIGTTCFPKNCECGNNDDPTIRQPLLRSLKINVRDPKMVSSIFDDYSSKIKYKDLYDNPRHNNEWPRTEDHEYKMYGKRSDFFQSNRGRKKRDFKDLSTPRPFWQIESFNSDRNPQLKTLRYTTLINRRRPKTRKQYSKYVTTESITLNIKNSMPKLVTEKYLSFDELLHLRKANLSSHNARRIQPLISHNETLETKLQDTKELREVKEPETKRRTDADKIAKQAENEEGYTTNTPFVRMKHCTRRLTCTWTVAAVTDNSGSVIPGNRGAKTPPGYVEGCTRTSTCTRDYMDRNKFPTLSTSSSSSEDEEDDDYCERRSLNVQKRNSHKIKRSLVNIVEKYVNSKDHKHSCRQHNQDNLNQDRFINRITRSVLLHPQCCSNNTSYGDLFYLVLRKIIGKWGNNKSSTFCSTQCHCNKGTKCQKIYISLVLFLLYLNFNFV